MINWLTNIIFRTWAERFVSFVSFERFGEICEWASWPNLFERLGVANFYELILRFQVFSALWNCCLDWSGVAKCCNLIFQLQVTHVSLTHPKPGVLLGQGSENVKVQILKSHEQVKVLKAMKKWKSKEEIFTWCSKSRCCHWGFGLRVSPVQSKLQTFVQIVQGVFLTGTPLKS